MYDEGRGVRQDYVEAVRWYRRAAERGWAAAQNSLGIMYFEGKGVPVNYLEAYAWYSIAAAQGNEYAAKNMQLIAAVMTREQLARAQRFAREYWQKYVLPFRN